MSDSGSRRVQRSFRNQARPRWQSPKRPTPWPAVGAALAGTLIFVLVASAATSSGPAHIGSAKPTSPGAASAGAWAASLGASSDVSSPSAAATPPLTGGLGATPSPNPSSSGGPGKRASRFGAGLLIADRGNGRLLMIDAAGKIRWRFPVSGSLKPGQRFSADDAFISPDGRSIVANEEEHQIIVRIDIATRKIVWEYGQYDRPGAGPGQLHTPDDAYPLANGNVIVADIENCRIIEIAPNKSIVHRWGRPGVCVDRAPLTYGRPNGDTPLPDGGMLVTEIVGSRVVRLSPRGHVVFDIHVPVRYPSDAQLDSHGNVLVVDYSSPGAVLLVSPRGHVLWNYRPSSGAARLDHPSLAIELADGTIALNDDFRHRVIVINPKTNRIVWQYGHTDWPGTGHGYLRMPDGIDPIPIGTAFDAFG